MTQEKWDKAVSGNWGMQSFQNLQRIGRDEPRGGLCTSTVHFVCQSSLSSVSPFSLLRNKRDFIASEILRGRVDFQVQYHLKKSPSLRLLLTSKHFLRSFSFTLLNIIPGNRSLFVPCVPLSELNLISIFSISQKSVKGKLGHHMLGTLFITTC